MRALPLCALLAACSFASDYGGSAYLCGPDGACPPGQICIDGHCLTGAVDASVVQPPESWWDDDWRARRPLVVRNLSDGTLASGYQVGWRVDLEGELGESNHDAVRVVQHQAAQGDWAEIPRVVDGGVVEQGGVIENEVVWFPLPGGLERDQETTVWIYYDADNPTPAPWNGSDVFELADSFANISGDRWVTSGAVAVVSEDAGVRFDSTSEMRSTEPFPIDRAVDVTARVSISASRLWYGFQREVPDLEPDVPWLVWIRREAGNLMLPEYAGPNDTVDTRWAGTAVPVGSEPRIYSVERLADRVVYLLDYQIASDDHDHPLDQAHIAPLYLRFSNTGSSSFWLTRVRVRHTANPPPELELGAREERPAP